MHREGHAGAALVTYAPVGAVVVAADNEGLAIAGGVVAVGLSMLPDWDQKIPLVTHRGVTHTVHFAGAVGAFVGLGGALSGAAGGLFAALAFGVFGFVVGTVTILSHIAADALTPMGVEPFGDGRHYSFDVARASNPLANYALLAVGVVAVAVGYGLGTTVAALVA